MKLLLDTHIFLWWDFRPKALSDRFSEAIRDKRNVVFVSVATIWEISIKRATGKLNFSTSIVDAIERHGFQSLSITAGDAEWAGNLPLLHRDPFDRVLVAQAQRGGMKLLTVDEKIQLYDVSLM